MFADVIGTDDVLKKLSELYERSYRDKFSTYFIELDFKTVLTYYSGVCSIIAELYTFEGLPVNVRMCIMIECGRDMLFSLDEGVMSNIIENEILKKYESFLCINRELCGKNFKRSITIKNTSFNEPAVAVRLERDQLILELNNNVLSSIERDDRDLFNIICSLSRHFEYRFGS